MIQVDKNKCRLYGFKSKIMAEFAILIQGLKDNGISDNEIKFAFKLGLSNIGNNGKIPVNEVEDLLNMIDPKLGKMFKEKFE